MYSKMCFHRGAASARPNTFRVRYEGDHHGTSTAEYLPGRRSISGAGVRASLCSASMGSQRVVSRPRSGACRPGIGPDPRGPSHRNQRGQDGLRRQGRVRDAAVQVSTGPYSQGRLHPRRTAAHPERPRQFRRAGGAGARPATPAPAGAVGTGLRQPQQPEHLRPLGAALAERGRSASRGDQGADRRLAAARPRQEGGSVAGRPARRQGSRRGPGATGPATPRPPRRTDCRGAGSHRPAPRRRLSCRA